MLPMESYTKPLILWPTIISSKKTNSHWLMDIITIILKIWFSNTLSVKIMLLGLGLGLQGLYSATNCADNILGRFTIILQNQIARVDSFTNLTKRWVFRFRLNASISSHNLISFGKQFHARGPYTANARLPKVSCLNFGTFRTRSSLDLMEYLLLFDGVIISWM